MEEDHRIAVSPIARDPSEIPTDISLAEYLLRNLRTHSARFGDRPWVADALTGTSVLLKDVEEHSRRMASALTRLGFKARDVLFFVTYEGAQIFLLQLAVWRLGGATRGWRALDMTDEYKIQIQDCRAKFVLVDEETAPLLQEAVSAQEWDVTLLCFGDVKGATKVNDLLSDDGSGEHGEIMINSPSNMLGYMQQDGTPNRSTFEADGYMHTGDLGFLDGEGNIYIIERLNFVFYYEGWAVLPAEIEGVLAEHEAVQAAGVVGIPNPDTETLSRAFVVLHAGYHVTADELQAHVVNRLNIHKHLHGGVRFVDSLPVNRIGKLERCKLKEIALQMD
ncbi:hypothetical protein B566_EDAN008425 [Ephemera danica]|nr:hypothetical protein B566_EDAN008425 [Ephemera danica]